MTSLSHSILSGEKIDEMEKKKTAIDCAFYFLDKNIVGVIYLVLSKYPKFDYFHA